MRVASLHIYPVKGTRAVNLDRAHLDRPGFEDDRRWLVVDADNRFITQRTHPRLATITAVPVEGGLRLSAPGIGTLAVETPPGETRITVTIWDATVSATLADAPAHDWLSSLFGEPLKLVHMDARAERHKIAVWTPGPVPVSFADAYPVTVVATGSLTALNRAIESGGFASVPMTRFRPNIVLDCDESWAEDRWKALRIGGAEFDLVKPSERCIVTTTDQSSGERMGDEPLATLRRIRFSGDPRANGVLFAWNAVPRVLGDIAVGDVAEILERRPEGFPIRAAGPREQQL